MANLEKENAELKETIKKQAENFEDVKKKAVEINENLQSDNDILKDEIKELKNTPAKIDEKPVREKSVKEKGFTMVNDIPKRKAEAKENAPEKNDSKK
jgi:predicted nuclease with TOPRIM domain